MLQKLPGFRPLTQHGEFTPPPPPPSSKSAKPICYSRFIRSADEKFFAAVFHYRGGKKMKHFVFLVYFLIATLFSSLFWVKL